MFTISIISIITITTTNTITILTARLCSVPLAVATDTGPADLHVPRGVRPRLLARHFHDFDDDGGSTVSGSGSIIITVSGRRGVNHSERWWR
jgi:hypothetical protein